MNQRSCPVCGVSVRLENLERHVANVHPGHPPVVLAAKEKRALRPHSRRGRRLRLKPYAAALLLIALVIASLALGLPRLSGPSPHGGMAMHWHPLLSIAIDGQPVSIPANIGIDPSLWNDRSLDEYGMQAMPEMGMGGMAPLHTHDASGTIHTESTIVRDYTVGEFFRIWGESFDDRQVLGHPAGSGHYVWMTVDGAQGPPSTSVVLRDGMRIGIICGPP